MFSLPSLAESSWSAVEYANNPVLVGSESYDAAGVREAEIYAGGMENGKYYMFYGGQDNTARSIGAAPNTGWSVCMATSPDLNTWTKRGKVLERSAGGWDNAVDDGEVFKFGDTYYMYYLGCNGGGGAYLLGLATSSNIEGPYTKWSGNPISLGAAYATVSVSILPYSYGGYKYIMFYSGGNGGSEWWIGVSFSSDLYHWTTGTPVSGLIQHEENTAMLNVGSRYFMLTNHFYPFSLYMYENTTSDLLSWKFVQVLLAPPTSGWDSGSVGMASTLYTNGKWYVFFDGTVSGGGLYDHKIGYAIATPLFLPPPPLGTLRVFATYQSSYVATTVSVTGPEAKTGATTTDPSNPLTFEVTPGSYLVSGTYFIQKSENVTVVKDQLVDVTLNFGGSLPPPPPELPLQLIFIVSAVASVAGLVFFARRKRTRHFSISRRRGKHRRQL